MSHDQGYYRQPALRGDDVIFVCETDLWSVPLAGGVARRLTAHQTDAASPHVSPDGRWIAFSAWEEGAAEVYVIPADGGQARRLTFQGSAANTIGFSRDGRYVHYTSVAEAPFLKMSRLWRVPVDGGPAELQPWGYVRRLALGEDGTCVICRREQESSRWKRYKGGTKGDLWVDEEGRGTFKEILPKLEGNLGWPCLVGRQLFFISDHEGHANVYSCALDGSQLKRCTHHTEFYARALSTDGARLVYQCGAEIYVYEPMKGTSKKVDIRINSSKPQLTRRFVSSMKNMTGYSLHPEGHSLCMTTRGKLFAFGNWEREVLQLGTRDGVRYRHADWLKDGKSVVAISDEGGEEALEIHAVDAERLEPSLLKRLDGLDIGHVRALATSPVGNAVALGNHRCEVLHVDLDSGKLTLLARSAYDDVRTLRFSPDGRFVAYTSTMQMPYSQIFVAEVATGKSRPVTRLVGSDMSPAWDPEGRYLYFLSARTFDPVYDTMRFDLGFPKGIKPYAIGLRKDVESPFDPMPKSLDGESAKKKDKSERNDKEEKGEKDDKAEKSGKDEPQIKLVEIDFDGIEDRVIEFPVPEARYGRLVATKGRVFFSETPIEGSLGRTSWSGERPTDKLHVFDMETLKLDVYLDAVDSYTVSRDGKSLVYRHGQKMRVVKSSVKPEHKHTKPGRQSGIVDMERVRISLLPAAEWKQMYREMWRLQRDHFWDIELSKVDWPEVYERYLPILARVATRSEFSDLAWELQGELGTSHAYEIGGDLRSPPPYSVGKLGAKLTFENDAWIVKEVVRGDAWDRAQDSPLGAMGVEVKPGDKILAIDGIPLSEKTTPSETLVQKAGVDVAMVIAPASGDKPRKVSVRPLGSEHNLRYRAWVEANRRRVHAETNGRVGYVHIPDMGARGFSEFMRYYTAESWGDGLVVDVRYNGGGHVSQLLLSFLLRRRTCYTVSHHFQSMPEPMYAVDGPIVAITNEFAGSDGDIFSHSFKYLKIGPLLGKRTWGGVIGIDSRNSLVDGTIVTQPEYSTWFKDVGYGLENYGTDPDIEIDIAPQDWAAGKDPQLDLAISEALKRLAEDPPKVPDFSQRPNLARPAKLT